ncbi:MAG: HEAT repeat domain-containing protein [Chitinophagaceae bacterium]|nr:HEAT repeat domain-containing protein [Chitinophagaceae bacterium]
MISKYFLCILIISACCFACTDGKQDAGGISTTDSTGPQVPPGFTIEVVADSTLIDYPMFSTLDEQGRLFVFESVGNVYEETQDAIDRPQFRIKLLTDTNNDGRYDKGTIFADKVGFPQGGVFYKGSLIASSAPDLIKFTDSDNDGVADKREVMLSGWILNVNANSLVGPSLSPDGWLYMNNAIMGFDVTTKEGKRLKGETARTWRLKPDGSQLEWVSAGGMNNPVEVTYTEAGEVIGTETYFTDPRAGERDALVYWIEGGVYPKPNENITRDKLVRTGELMPVISKFSRVAPSGITRYRGNILGDDFKDNLFSAQFNTHRVLRHKLIREGGSFRTEDEIFFWNNSNEDFHPTDVLEDADGSLLIVETGGWFIKGCPLSQVSKPELKGAIYRVRRKDAGRENDPYGNNIKWSALTPEALTQHLEKSNPFIGSRAQQSVIDLGTKSIPVLTGLLKASSSADARTKAVFALYGIGTSEAMTPVIEALNDREVQVAIAAARSLGLSKYKPAVQPLIKLLSSAPDPVVRQAATALGQINDKQAAAPLLLAAEKANDRFIGHAIIYSLISLGDINVVRTGLIHSSPNVREAALIALDQMTGSSLKAVELTNFLLDKNEKLQQTALWIASHHPEWCAELISFFDHHLKDSLNSREEKLFTDILSSFNSDRRMQQFIASKVATGSDEKKIFFLNAMSNVKGQKFPAVWISAISNQLSAPVNAQVKAKAIELVQLHNISSLDASLKKIADDTNASTTLRLQALLALKEKPLTEKHFTFLYNQLTSTNEVSIRQQASAVLEQSHLSEQQLKHIADNYLPSADPFILPRIVHVFAGAHSEETGKKLATILTSSSALDGFSIESIQKLFEKYPAGVKPSVDQLIAKLNVVHGERLKKLVDLEKNVSNGVLDRGRALFFGKATCSTCHTIGSQGGKFAPDLTSIQKDRSVHDLLEAIVYPDVSLVREYETYRVVSKSGAHTGLVRTKDPEAIIVETSPQSSVRILRKDIVSSELTNASMMPQGLDKILSPQEMADLITFLIGQDQDPETDQQILRRTVIDK